MPPVSLARLLGPVFMDREVEHEPAELSDAEGALAETLHSLDGAHNYRDWLLELFFPHLRTGSVVYEVGAGHGTFTGHLAQKARVYAIEPAASGHDELSRQFSGDDRVVVIHGDHRDLPDEPADLIILSNVLEHIKDEHAALEHFLTSLRPGGRLVVFSPAFDLLYSRFDAMVGHYRRYRAPTLRRRMQRAGYDVVVSRYVNIVGFFTWLVYARLLRRIPTTSGVVTLYDRIVVPVMRRLERGRRLPFGQSVLCVGQRPASPVTTPAS